MEFNMLQIRKSVFETNSSSSHSVNISTSGDIDTSLIPNDNGVLVIDSKNQFGWEQEYHNDASTKAMYAHLQSQYSGNPQHVEMLNKVIRDQTGADEIIFLGDIHADWSSNINAYIDHQSAYCEAGFEPFESEESLRNFIFNKQSYVETDNDNH